jgi:hypothetical protein
MGSLGVMNCSSTLMLVRWSFTMNQWSRSAMSLYLHLWWLLYLHFEMLRTSFWYCWLDLPVCLDRFGWLLLLSAVLESSLCSTFQFLLQCLLAESRECQVVPPDLYW